MASPHRLLCTPALGSRSRPGAASLRRGAPETEILWYVYYYLSNVHERWQWTSPIVYGVNWCHPLLQKFMQACLSAGLQGIRRLERLPSIWKFILWLQPEQLPRVLVQSQWPLQLCRHIDQVVAEFGRWLEAHLHTQRFCVSQPDSLSRSLPRFFSLSLALSRMYMCVYRCASERVCYCELPARTDSGLPPT